LQQKFWRKIENEDQMLVSAIIPIGNLAKDLQNIKSVIFELLEFPMELIFVLDTNEHLADSQLLNLCRETGIKNYQILKSSGRNPGTSRNVGISAANGDWLVFFDSDDMPNAKNIISEVTSCNTNIDIIIGTYEVQSSSPNSNQLTSIFHNSDLLWPSISLNPGLWRWVIRREFVHDVTFPALSMGEDQCYLAKLLQNNPEIIFSPKIFYRYRRSQNNSLTNSKAKINDLIEIIKMELSLKNFPLIYRKVKNYIVIRQLLTLAKNGNSIIRLEAFKLFFKFIFSLSPKDYITSIKFIFKVFWVELIE